MTTSDWLRSRCVLERARLRFGAQVIDAVAAGREHRQHAVDRAGGEHERVVADALAGIGHDHPRRAIDRRHPRAALERDAVAAMPFGPAIGVSWGSGLPVSTAFDSGGFS